jgi:cell division septum initiation protein DivIVA
MDIASRLKQLEDLVAEAKGMPLSSSVLLNRDEVLEVIQSVRDSLPEEVKQARWVVKDREELLAKARKDAEGVIQQALEEQGRLASKEEVVKRARQEADALLGEAREEARHIRLEAEDYIDAQLAAFEAAVGKVREDLLRATEDVEGLQDRLTKVTEQIQTGRQRLRGGTIAQEELTAEVPEEPVPVEEQEVP